MEENTENIEKPMSEYRVEWTIDIFASSPEEAAKRALDIQKEEGSWATCFVVTDNNGKSVAVDLARCKEE